MYLFRWTFESTDPPSDELFDRLYDLVICLERNGQIAPENFVARLTGAAQIVGQVPLLDALDPSNHSQYVRRALQHVMTAGGGQGVVAVEPHVSAAQHTLDIIGTPWLVLRTEVGDGLSPVWCPMRKLAVPLYRLPLDPDVRERIFFWARLYRRISGVEWSCGPLELEAYRELNDPASGLLQESATHARVIEDALGMPVYTYVLHAVAHPDHASERTCPQCDATWVVADEPYAYRCEPCRLVSDHPCTVDAEDWDRLNP